MSEQFASKLAAAAFFSLLCALAILLAFALGHALVFYSHSEVQVGCTAPGTEYGELAKHD